MLYGGEEIVGEGTGFGVPALLYSDETYFSGSAHVHLYTQKDISIIRKEYIMNRVHRKNFLKIRLENKRTRSILRHLCGLYQDHRHFRFLTLKITSTKMGINTSFAETTQAGNVIVTYIINKDIISVTTDFSHVKKDNLKKIFIFNEQGTRFLRKYQDSKGTKLIDKQVNAWEIINTEWASVTDIHDILGFRLWRAENTILRRGREFIKDHRDWIGLDYEINPKNEVFEYKIEIVGA